MECNLMSSPSASTAKIVIKYIIIKIFHSPFYKIHKISKRRAILVYVYIYIQIKIGSVTNYNN